MRRLSTILTAVALAAVAGTVSAQTTVNQAAIDNIMTRSSIRTFEQKSVEADKIETLLRAGMAAPTSRDMQPWHFVVLSDKETVSKFAATNPHHGDQIKQTPLIIVVCGDTTRMQAGEARDFWVEDCSAASENILLAAHALGLGAVWTSVYPQMRKVNGIRRNLNLPANLVPFNSIRIGYPAEAAEVKDKWDDRKVTYWK